MTSVSHWAIFHGGRSLAKCYVARCCDVRHVNNTISATVWRFHKSIFFSIWLLRPLRPLWPLLRPNRSENGRYSAELTLRPKLRCIPNFYLAGRRQCIRTHSMYVLMWVDLGVTCHRHLTINNDAKVGFSQYWRPWAFWPIAAQILAT